MSRAGSGVAAVMILMVLLAATVCRPAGATTIGDVTRVEGQRINKLHGLGLVVGLKGTGDGGEFQPAIRPLAQLLQQLSDPVISSKELEEVKNVALVTITATIPETGCRMGDRLDVQVQSIGSCKSLKGGRLFLAPLRGPQKNSIVYALAEGPIRLENDQVPTVGVVDGGAVLEEEVMTEFVEDNRFRLVFTVPTNEFSLAAAVADVINQHTEYEVGYAIARALDARTVEVQVPEVYRKDPVPFLGRIQRLDLILPRRKACVKINERAGTILVTDNVEISPTVISHKTLVVATQPVVQATATPQGATGTTGPAAVQVQDGPFYSVDPQNEGGPRLQDLVAALNVLKVEAADRIAIVKLLAQAGQIQGEVSFVE